MLFFKQILNRAAKNFGYTIERLDTCLVDVLVPLLIHLDGAQTYTGAFGKFCLCTAVGGTDAFQVGVFEIITDSLVRYISEFCDVGLVEYVIRVLQVLVR